MMYNWPPVKPQKVKSSVENTMEIYFLCLSSSQQQSDVLFWHCFLVFSGHSVPPPPAQPTATPVQSEVSQTIPHQIVENIQQLLPLLLANSTVRSTEQLRPRKMTYSLLGF